MVWWRSTWGTSSELPRDAESNESEESSHGRYRSSSMMANGMPPTEIPLLSDAADGGQGHSARRKPAIFLCQVKLERRAIPRVVLQPFRSIDPSRADRVRAWTAGTGGTAHSPRHG